MGAFKEIVMDGTFRGAPLPTNVFWVAAINPSTQPKLEEEMASRATARDLGTQV